MKQGWAKPSKWCLRSAGRSGGVVLIVPSTLRKQWQQELMDKFGIESEILESAAFRQRGILNAFDQPGKVMIRF